MRTHIVVGIGSIFCLTIIFAFFSTSFLSVSSFISPIPESVLARTFDTPPLAKTPTPALSPTPSPTLTPTPLPPTPTPIKSEPTITPTPTLTPTPTPLPPITFASGSDLDKWFDQYSKQYNIDRSLLHNIAACESGFRTDAVNGEYAGMYQFSEQAWTSTRSRMSADTNKDLRFNAEESIKTAAFVIANNGTLSWPNCNK